MEQLTSNDFFTSQEIISQKFAKGWFGAYKQTQNYRVFNWTLHDIVFDMNNIGSDPIKLLRSILLYIPESSIDYIIVKLEHSNKYLHEILAYIFLPDITHAKIQKSYKMAGLIHVLTAFDYKPTVYKVVAYLLGFFLGAKSISFDNQHNDNKKIEQLYRGSYIFGEFRLVHVPSISECNSDCEWMTPYIKERNTKLATDSSKKKLIKLEKGAVKIFLKNFAGFKESEITYVIEMANKNKIPLKLSEFYSDRKRLQICIPNYLRPELDIILYDGGIHSKALTMECPACWILDQPGMCKGKCRTHGKSTMSLGKNLKDIATAQQQQQQPVSPIPTAPPLNKSGLDVEHNGNLTCSICMENNKNCTLIPCGHCYCMICVSKVDKCPDCREAFIQIQKIFV